MITDKNILLEKLADLEHQQWQEWVKYMITNWSPSNVEKWKKQLLTKYSDLSETEKSSDRRWASKVLGVLHN